MAETTIEWADYTFNPWEGCSKVSEGCANCYAEARANRWQTVQWGPQGTRRIAAESAWKQPLRWNRDAEKAGERRRVFCASLADVFEDRPELVAPRVRLFHLISETRNLIWLLLTKRPENIRRFHGGDGIPRSWPESMPPNVWLGVSVENQHAADDRIPILLQTPARVRFLSCEPLLGAVDLRQWLDAYYCPRCSIPSRARPKREWGIHPHLGYAVCTTCRMHAHDGELERALRPDWVIVGGESGPKARPFLLEWAESLRDQCRAAGVAFFLKQIGSAPRRLTGLGVAEVLTPDDPKGGNPEEWPEDLRVREFPCPRS